MVCDERSEPVLSSEPLNYTELLQLDPAGGVIRFAGERALLIDAVAMGLLRKYLVENFGATAARTLLVQFGFAHGWRRAEALESAREWEGTDSLRRACTRIHSLEGLFTVASGSTDPLAKTGSVLAASYEAEQHILHFGQAEEPMCWTISGLMSGYLSRALNDEVYVLEDRCLGKGDAACHLFGRTRAEWGDARAEELRYFEAGHLRRALDVSLQRVVESLKTAERKLAQRRRLVQITERIDPLGLVARSDAMRRVVDLAKRVAKVDSTVLITGESGTGKERVARLVHDESARAAGPFVAVNCGAITETLLEAELFGHARGAFTGASHDRPGLFEAANGGTLLLDEVGELSLGMQVKLLRVLQEREVRRVGENNTRKIDVRIVAATNKDLTQSVANGGLRQDLYYRLKVVELHVPPLRERKEDLALLSTTLLAESALRMKRAIAGISPAVADQLLRYSWPGNVRELYNVMERAVALSQGNTVELEDLPEEIRVLVPTPTVTAGKVRPLEEIERDYILAALSANAGNHTHTATQLQIGSATLYRKLKSYGVAAARSDP